MVRLQWLLLLSQETNWQLSSKEQRHIRGEGETHSIAILDCYVVIKLRHHQRIRVPRKNVS